MNRKEVIQKIIDKTGAKTYLEIGVEFGTAFLRIRAKRKIAVDPVIRIPWYKKLYFSRGMPRSRYFKIPSDEFFNRYSNLFAENKIDVAFVDGLHTYEQSLKDVENCLKYLSANGIIVMHDCLPPNAAAAAISMELAKKMPDWNQSWCGDVWKTVVYLRSKRRDLKVFVLDCDYGLGIIMKGEPENMLEYSVQDIKQMTYEDLKRDQDHLLNLKSTEYFEDFLSSLKLF